jgi:hypothetical protein
MVERGHSAVDNRFIGKGNGHKTNVSCIINGRDAAGQRHGTCAGADVRVRVWGRACDPCLSAHSGYSTFHGL